jgi:hypothetical protein
MLYASLYIIRPLDKPKPSSSKGVLKYVPWTIAVAFSSIFFVQRSPWSYYLYVFLPAYFWSQFMHQGIPYLSTPTLQTHFLTGLRDNAFQMALVIGALLGLAVCLLSPKLFSSSPAVTYSWDIPIGLFGPSVPWLLPTSGFSTKIAEPLPVT